MKEKHVYISSGHNFNPVIETYKTFDDIKTGNLIKLIKSKKRWKPIFEIPVDGFKFTRKNNGEVVFASYSTQRKNTRSSRVILLNCEVGFQYSSGTYWSYIFDNILEAVNFFKYCIPNAEINIRLKYDIPYISNKVGVLFNQENSILKK